MKDVPEKQRAARFVCAIAAVFPNGKVLTAIDTIEGIIAQQIKREKTVLAMTLYSLFQN